MSTQPPPAATTAAESPLPDYTRFQQAYHRAHARELRQVVADLPLAPGQRVLDMACGEGFYLPWLSQGVAPGGQVVAFDLLPAYLAQARQHVDEQESASIELVAGSIEQLPLAPESFDLVWCAQSLISLPGPRKALRQMATLARPGGVVAVLENDSLHELLLPWPAELELAVRRAELEALEERRKQPSKFYAARRLDRDFAAAGLTVRHRQTYTADRRAPLPAEDHLFLTEYFADLRERVRAYMEPDDWKELERLTDRDSADYLPHSPDFAMTYLDVLLVGQRT